MVQRLAALALLGILATACGGVPGEQTGTSAQAVLGEVSTDPFFHSAVRPWSLEGGTCSGVLVAPRLVLTARHCVAAAGANEAVLLCNPDDKFVEFDAIGATIDGVSVYTHELSDWVGQADANVVKIYTSAQPNICTHDIAILELDQPIRDIAPASIRLENTTKSGEEFTMVGWGVMDTLGTQAWRRYERDSSVLAVGPTYHQVGDLGQLPVVESAMLAQAGGCSGDSGAPAYSKETGAVIGIQNWLIAPEQFELTQPTKNCADPLAFNFFVHLPQHKSWVMDVFHQAGYTPHLEGRPAPSYLGGECTDDLDCHTGMCLDLGSVSVCSQDCSSSACPEGFECVAGEGTQACVPLGLQAEPEGEPSDCSVAVRPRAALPERGMAALLVLLVWASRRMGRRGRRV